MVGNDIVVIRQMSLLVVVHENYGVSGSSQQGKHGNYGVFGYVCAH